MISCEPMAMNQGDGYLRDKHTDTCVLLTSISEFSAVQYVRHSDFFTAIDLSLAHRKRRLNRITLLLD